MAIVSLRKACLHLRRPLCMTALMLSRRIHLARVWILNPLSSVTSTHAPLQIASWRTRGGTKCLNHAAHCEEAPKMFSSVWGRTVEPPGIRALTRRVSSSLDLVGRATARWRAVGAARVLLLRVQACPGRLHEQLCALLGFTGCCVAVTELQLA